MDNPTISAGLICFEFCFRFHTYNAFIKALEQTFWKKVSLNGKDLVAATTTWTWAAANARTAAAASKNWSQPFIYNGEIGLILGTPSLCNCDVRLKVFFCTNVAA